MEGVIRFIVDFILWIIRGVISIFVGLFVGAVTGYWWFSYVPFASLKIDIGNADISGKIGVNIPVTTILNGDERYLAEIDLEPIRDNIAVCTIIGALFGLLIFIYSSIKAVRRKQSIIFISEEIIKLAELMHQGKISEQEYVQMKRKIIRS